MRFVGSFILCLAVGACCSPVVLADDLAMASNPYSTITERNVFALVPIPPAPDPSTLLPPADPPPKITIQGMMTLFGKPQVLFKFSLKPLAGQQPKEESFVLGEGERQEEVEVTKIDMAAKVASFINHGVAQDVPLSDTAKLSTPAAADAGARPMAGGIPLPTMGGGLNRGAAARLARAAGGNPGATGNPGTGDAGDAPGAGNSGVPSQIYNAANETPANFNPDVAVAKLAQNYLDAKARNPSQAALFPLTDKDKQALEAAAGAGQNGNQ